MTLAGSILVGNIAFAVAKRRCLVDARPRSQVPKCAFQRIVESMRFVDITAVTTSARKLVLVKFVLTIDPSVNTLHSTSLSYTLRLIFMTRALRTFLSPKCVRKVCASHPHGSGAVISIHSGRILLSRRAREQRIGVAELRESCREPPSSGDSAL